MLLQPGFCQSGTGVYVCLGTVRQSCRGLAPLKIAGVKAIPTGQWVFLKVFDKRTGTLRHWIGQ